jgi:hypothetical protein
VNANEATVVEDEAGSYLRGEADREALSSDAGAGRFQFMPLRFDRGVVEDACYAKQAGDVFECRGSLLVTVKFAEQRDATVGDFYLDGILRDRCVPR